MLIQIRDQWIMVATHANAKARMRVEQKKARRECVVPDCTKEMVTLGCCRGHADSALRVIASQPTERQRKEARERLIRDGLLLPVGEQPRRFKQDSRASVYRAALAG